MPFYYVLVIENEKNTRKKRRKLSARPGLVGFLLRDKVRAWDTMSAPVLPPFSPRTHAHARGRRSTSRRHIDAPPCTFVRSGLYY